MASKPPAISASTTSPATPFLSIKGVIPDSSGAVVQGGNLVQFKLSDGRILDIKFTHINTAQLEAVPGEKWHLIALLINDIIVRQKPFWTEATVSGAGAAVDTGSIVPLDTGTTATWQLIKDIITGGTIPATATSSAPAVSTKDLQDQIDQLEIDKKALQNANAGLMRQCDGYLAERDRIAAERDRIAAERNRIDIEKGQLKADYADLERRMRLGIGAKNEELDDLQKLRGRDQEGFRVALNQKQAELDNAVSNLKRAQDDLKRVEDNFRLQGEKFNAQLRLNAEQDKRIQMQQQEIERQAALIHNLGNEKNAAERARADTQAKLDIANVNLQNSVNQIAQLNERIGRLTDELDKLQDANRQNLDRIQQAHREERRQLEGQLDQATRRAGSLQTNLTETERQLQELRERLRNLERNPPQNPEAFIQDLRRQIEALNNAKEQLQAQLQKVQQDNQRVHEQNEAATRELQRVTDIARKNEQQLQNQIRELQQTQTQSAAALTAAQQAREQLQFQLEQSEARNRELGVQHEQALKRLTEEFKQAGIGQQEKLERLKRELQDATQKADRLSKTIQDNEQTIALLKKRDAEGVEQLNVLRGQSQERAKRADESIEKAERENNKLRERLAEVEGNRAHLQKEMTQLREQHAQALDKLSKQLGQENSDLRATITRQSDALRRLNEVEQEAYDARRAAQDKQTEIDRLAERIGDLQAKHAREGLQSQHQIEQLQQEQQRSRTALADVQQENQELQRNLEQANTRAQDLNRQMGQLQEEQRQGLATLQDKLTNDFRQAFGAQQARFTEENERLKQALQDATQKANDLTRTIQHNDHAIAQLKQANSQATQQLAEQERQSKEKLDRSLQDVQKLDEDNRGLRGQLTDEERQRQQLRNELHQAREAHTQALNELQNQLRGKNAENAQLNETILRQNEAISRQKALLEEMPKLEEAVETVRQFANAKDDEIRTLTDLNQQQRNQIGEIGNQLAEERRKNQAVEEELRAQIERLTAQIPGLRNEISHTQEQLSHINEQLAAKTAALDRLQAEKDQSAQAKLVEQELIKEKTELGHRIEELNAQLGPLQHELDQANAQVTELQNQIRATVEQHQARLMQQARKLEEAGQKDEQIAELQKRNQELQQQYARQIGDLARKAERAEAEAEDLVRQKSEKLEALQRQLDEQTSTNKGLLVQIRMNKERVDAQIKDALAATEQSYVKVVLKNENLSERNGVLVKANAELTQELEALRKQNLVPQAPDATNLEEVHRLKEKINDLSEQHDQALRKARDQAYGEIRVASLKAQAAEKQKTAAQNTLAELRAEHDAVKAELDQLKASLADYVSPETMTKEFIPKYNGLKDQLQQAEANYEALKEKLADKEAALTESEQSGQAKDKDIERLNGKLKDQHEEIRHLKGVANKTELPREVQDKLAHQQLDIESLQEKNSELQQQISDKDEEYAQLQDQIRKFMELAKKLTPSQQVSDKDRDYTQLKKEIKEIFKKFTDELIAEILSKSSKIEDLQARIATTEAASRAALAQERQATEAAVDKATSLQEELDRLHEEMQSQPLSQSKAETSNSVSQAASSAPSRRASTPGSSTESQPETTSSSSSLSPSSISTPSKPSRIPTLPPLPPKEEREIERLRQKIQELRQFEADLSHQIQKERELLQKGLNPKLETQQMYHSRGESLDWAKSLLEHIMSIEDENGEIDLDALKKLIGKEGSIDRFIKHNGRSKEGGLSYRQRERDKGYDV